MTVDLAIVGAGPAGMAAAALAAELGLDTLLIDEQDGPGGQIYRAIERADDARLVAARRRLSRRPARWSRRCAASGARLPPGDDGLAYRPGRHAVPGERRRERHDRRARRILLATGAIERPVPIPGWTLPGVMTVGRGADPAEDRRPRARRAAPCSPAKARSSISLRCSWPAPARRRSALLETTPHENYHAALAQPRRRLGGPPRACERVGLTALGCAAPASRCGAVCAVCAPSADERVERVAWDGGEIAADHLFLHEGVIPNTQISLALQLRASTGTRRSCAGGPVTDEWGRTSLPNIAIAGDGAGIAGAEAADPVGAARRARCRRRARPDRRGRARPARGSRSARRSPASGRSGRFSTRSTGRRRRFWRPPRTSVIACRCEEVTVGQIRRAVRLGAPGPNQLKAFTRCGMGPCQGRICGPIVSAVIAEARGVPIAGNRHLSPARPLQADHGRRPCRLGSRRIVPTPAMRNPSDTPKISRKLRPDDAILIRWP